MSRLAKLCCVLGVCVPALLLAGRTSAQDADAAESAAQLFAQGQLAAKRKDWSEAYRLYRAAWTIKPSYDAAANVAHSAIKLGRVADGAAFFAYTLRHFPATGDAQKRAAFTNYLELARQKVMTIHVTTNPATAEVFVDGHKPVDTVFLEPGEHVIEARAPGFESARETITATPGDQRDLHLVLKQELAPAARAIQDSPSAASPPAARPSVVAPTPDPSPADARRARSIVPALVAGGVAVVGLGSGVAFTLSADSKESKADAIRGTTGASGCAAAGATADCARLRELTESEDRHKTFAAIGFVAGTIGAVTAVGYLLWPRGEPSRSTGAVRKNELFATPLVGPGVAGVVLRSGF